ncbi:MAG: hypothetical protein PHU40_02250 [Sulfurimonas sp.]|jgi:cytochrome c553|nr:hypothetical protein [Sulfurimonas sp.]
MLFKDFQFKNSNLFSVLSFSFLLLAAGCNDKADESRTNNASSAAQEKAKIEIVANENAREIKVADKIVDANQSKSYYYDYNIKSAFNENSTPANEDASISMKPRSSMDANMHVRSPYENIQISMIVNKLSKEFILKCSACHNDYANGVIGPSLLGKDSDYIFNKIADFKNGTKTNVLMRDLIKQMSDEEIRALADEIYTFNKKINEMRK